MRTFTFLVRRYWLSDVFQLGPPFLILCPFHLVDLDDDELDNYLCSDSEVSARRAAWSAAHGADDPEIASLTAGMENVILQRIIDSGVVGETSHTPTIPDGDIPPSADN